MSNINAKRHPIAMVHVGIPLTEVNQWSSDKEIVEAMKKRLAEVGFPSDAHVTAWFSFIPDNQCGYQVKLQNGFFEDPDDNIPFIDDLDINA